MPWEELSHTADLSLRVWGEDRRALFEDAALGMLALMGCESKASTQPLEKTFDMFAPDWETLLVDWLTELLYLADDEGVAITSVDVMVVADCHLRAAVSGLQGGQYVKLIKAVTYHDLAIESTNRGFEAVIVFDV